MKVHVTFAIAENISDFYASRLYSSKKRRVTSNRLAWTDVLERGVYAFGGAWDGGRMAPAWALPWNRNAKVQFRKDHIINKQMYGMYYHR